METIRNSISNSFDILRTIRVPDVIDILIVAFLIYKAIMLIKKTNLHNIAKGIIVILMILGLSEAFKLTMINYLLRKMVELGLIALVVLFQPELRKLLEKMGSFTAGKTPESSALDKSIEQIVLACTEMSETKTGALIVIERSFHLADIIRSGTVVNADINAELVKNVFFKNAPLHDGAMIIRDNRIAAAGCVLPLTKKNNLSKELGTRHRAGIGMSEQSDAVVLIVSEETGAVSVAIEGMLKRHLSAATLDKLLRSELMREDDVQQKKGFLDKLKMRFTVKIDDKEQSEK